MGRSWIRLKYINKMPGEEAKTMPREEEARNYLSQHKVLELFDNLTAQLMYTQPDHPKDFLIEKIEQLIKSRLTKHDHPCLFDESNIQAVFGMLDPTDRGYIKLQQYTEALQSMGINNFQEAPPGGDLDRITYDIFLQEARNGLQATSSPFQPVDK